MNAGGTAIFIEPTGTLLRAVVERKAWLERSMPGQAFCSHPPHCTLLFGDYGSSTRWLDELRRCAGGMQPFELETDRWHQFSNDPMTGGGQTIAFRVRLSEELALVQRVVAECLAPFASADATAHPLSNTEPFASSIREFGFPFVGTHWIPHFTVGSPLVGSEASIVSRLMSGPVRHRCPVRSISVWRVEGDRHERLHELALTGGPSDDGDVHT